MVIGPILWLQSYLEVLCMGHNLVGRLEVHEKQAQLPDRPRPAGKQTECKIEAKPTSPRDSRLIRPMPSCH